MLKEIKQNALAVMPAEQSKIRVPTPFKIKNSKKSNKENKFASTAPVTQKLKGLSKSNKINRVNQTSKTSKFSLKKSTTMKTSSSLKKGAVVKKTQKLGSKNPKLQKRRFNGTQKTQKNKFSEQGSGAEMKARATTIIRELVRIAALPRGQSLNREDVVIKSLARILRQDVSSLQGKTKASVEAIHNELKATTLFMPTQELAPLPAKEIKEIKQEIKQETNEMEANTNAPARKNNRRRSSGRKSKTPKAAPTPEPEVVEVEVEAKLVEVVEEAAEVVSSKKEKSKRRRSRKSTGKAALAPEPEPKVQPEVTEVAPEDVVAEAEPGIVEVEAEAKPEVVEVAEVAEAEAKPVQNNYEDMKYRDLQKECKKRGLSAGGSGKVLLARLIEDDRIEKSTADLLSA